MNKIAFTKRLTANDTGESGAHQAGIHIPKGAKELIEFLPRLDASIKNPDAWLTCTDEEGRDWSFRYVFYNNKMHDPGGTRNEYRITHMTKYFRAFGATEGDNFKITSSEESAGYTISIEPSTSDNQLDEVGKIKLAGWKRVH
ncbi:EcoRII N-terminal effector-binding domain-containing protein [Tateyamaria sp.]|uniref:EcoRII N-terminal effector-binding domain-containing protein n=1 Tax=Tateyamaria sp. TaxID=1929288 RepID=UPI0032A113B6